MASIRVLQAFTLQLHGFCMATRRMLAPLYVRAWSIYALQTHRHHRFDELMVTGRYHWCCAATGSRNGTLVRLAI